MEQGGKSALPGTDRGFVGICELQAIELVAIGADDLDAHCQSLIVETRRHGERRTSRHRDQQGPFHPFVISLHRRGPDRSRPMLFYVEREDLRGGHDEIVVALKELTYDLIPLVRTTEAAVIS